MTVGNRGSGTLNVEAGGTVSNTDGYIGSGSFEGSSGFKTGTGVVTVTGFTWTDTNNDGLREPAEVAGSQWNNSDDLTVCNWGDGKLNVKDGARYPVTPVGSVTKSNQRAWQRSPVLIRGGKSRKA